MNIRKAILYVKEMPTAKGGSNVDDCRKMNIAKRKDVLLYKLTDALLQEEAFTGADPHAGQCVG